MKFNYEELKSKAISFYRSLEIKIPDNLLEQAVQSLTMPQFAKEYNDINEIKLNDHRALSTVGDAVCGSYVMIKEYEIHSTSDELTKKKNIVTNNHLNDIGKNMLQGKLFSTNDDVKITNKKSYATAFEAIIGFISLISVEEAFAILKKYLN